MNKVELFRTFESKKRLSQWERDFLEAYHSLKTAKDQGIRVEQILRLLEPIYHVSISSIHVVEIPDVFYPKTEVGELEDELKKAKELRKESRKLMYEQCEQDHIEDILRS